MEGSDKPRSGSLPGTSRVVTQEHRDRSGSTSSQKRRREAENSDEDMEIEQEELPDTVDMMRESLEDFLFKETSKISKNASSYILKLWRQMEKICYDKIVQRADAVAENRILKEVLKGVEQQPLSKPKSYSQAASSLPKVGKKTVVPRDAEKVVLVYQKDESKVDSEETKKVIKQVIMPKESGIQIRAIRKVQKGGVVVESGTRKGAQKIRELASRVETLKIAAPRRILPKMIIYDVDRDLVDSEIQDYMYKQNLEEAGVKKKEMEDGFRICYRTGRRDLPVVNLVVEVSPKIREILLDAGRVYIDFAACRCV